MPPNIPVAAACCFLPSQNGDGWVTLGLPVSIILCRKDREMASLKTTHIIVEYSFPASKYFQNHSLSTSKCELAKNQSCPTFKFTFLLGGGHRISTWATFQKSLPCSLSIGTPLMMAPFTVPSPVPQPPPHSMILILMWNIQLIFPIHFKNKLGKH